MSELIFVDDNYEITYEHRNSTNITVSFASAGALNKAVRIEEFKSTVLNYDSSYICVIPKHLDWYNNINTIPMFHFLKTFCSNYEKIYTIGESLGGSGALLFSRFCERIYRTLAFSPQYSALSSFCKWGGPLTPMDGMIQKFMFSDYAPEAAREKSVLFFPANSYEDTLHSRFFKSEDFEVIFIDTHDHAIASHLKKEYQLDYLSLITKAFYNDEFRYNASSYKSLLFDIIETSVKPFSKWIGDNTFHFYHFLGISPYRLISKGCLADQSSICADSKYQDTKVEAQNALNEPVGMLPSILTAYEPRPWWGVDLGAEEIVKEVRVFNRCDNENFNRQFMKFSIYASMDNRVWTKIHKKVSSEIIGGEYGKPFQLLKDFKARYIKIMLAGTGYLSLSKVEIYGL